MTQWEAVKKHLDEKGSISSFEAYDLYGITRLSHIIYMLRKKGEKIENKHVTKKNRYGHSTTYDEYIQVPQQEN